jgi:general secretion pathway protein C
LLETLVVSAATLGAAALLAYVLAYWTWAWLAPRPEPRQAASEAPRIETAYALFGEAAARENAARQSVALTLLGIASASGRKPGYSLLRVDGTRTLVVREGEEITPGLKVAEIHPDRVVLDRGGARETLAWPVRSTTAARQDVRSR